MKPHPLLRCLAGFMLRGNPGAAIALLFPGASALLSAPGDVDLTFNPSPDGGVETTAAQPDGKLVFGGSFTSVGSVTRRRFARLHADGTLDTAYDPNANANPFNSGQIYACVVQPDGRIFVGGGFTNFGGSQRFNAARINANGTLDQGFNPNAGGGVISAAIQPDGKLLIGGDFTTIGGVARNHVARLNPDGTLDAAFNPSPNSSVYGISVQPDGKIVIGGSFVTVGGVTRNRVARLNPNGTLDTSFNPDVGRTGDSVECTMLQADGMILIAGEFDTVGGQTRNNMARLNSSGSLDTSFNPNVNELVLGMAVQCDGKIVIAGNFTRVGGVTRNRVARLTSRGPLDTSFTVNGTGADQSVYQTGIQADGKVIIAGYFSTVGGAPRRSIARLINDPATQSLTIPSTRSVRWLRGGSSPEADHVTFQLSTDNQATWQTLGFGSRDPGGWLLGGLNLPRTGHVRARARISAGRGSSGLVESVEAFALSPEVIVLNGPGTSSPPLTDGQSETVDFGTTRQGTPVIRSFTIFNIGAAPLSVRGLTLPEGYTLMSALPATVEIGLTLTVQVRLDAAALGTFAGTLTIANDDTDEGEFDFPVTGTVITPEIVVHDGDSSGPELADGQAAPVDFGRHVQGTPGVRSFTIANTGSANLLVSSIAVPAGYTLLSPPPPSLTVGAGQSTSLRVSLTTLTTGTHTGSVVITSDDFDEAVFDFPVTGEVFIPDPVAAVSGSTTTLNRQTGLREQTIRIANDTTATVPAYNLIIRGLPDGVEVNNASERRADGSWVVYVRQTMNPRSTQDILLEYFSANRAPTEIAPQLSTEVVLNPPDLSVPGQGFVIDRVLRLDGGAVLLEFPTTPGRTYQVQYSNDGTAWQVSLPAIRAAATRTQWTDRGLPRTDCHPFTHASRFYRVAELAP